MAFFSFWQVFSQARYLKPLLLLNPICNGLDVTSSYLEGENNQLAAYGYNRDKKRKQQLVIGLLCDESGEPVSIGVFPGNTQAPLSYQLKG